MIIKIVKEVKIEERIYETSIELPICFGWSDEHIKNNPNIRLEGYFLLYQDGERSYKMIRSISINHGIMMYKDYLSTEDLDSSNHTVKLIEDIKRHAIAVSKETFLEDCLKRCGKLKDICEALGLRL